LGTKKELVRRSDLIEVKSFGLPLRRRPDGAVKVLHGPDKVSYRHLVRQKATLSVPVVKFITVKVSEPDTSPPWTISSKRKVVRGVTAPPKEERTLKKKLLELKPWEYLKASSDPKFGLRERAFLKSLKHQFYNLWNLMEDALKEVRTGRPRKAKRCLNSILRIRKEFPEWSLGDHLVYRYAQWAMGQVVSATQVLRALGISSQDIREALPLARRTVGLSRPLFVSD